MTVEMDDTDKVQGAVRGRAKNFGIDVRAARRQPRQLPLRAGRPTRSIRYGLGAVKGTGQRRDRGDRRGARRGRAVHEPVRLLRARRPQPHQQARGRGADQGRRLRCAAAEPRRRCSPRVDRAFDFANATEANADQGGLFDDGRPHGASTQEPELVDATPWGVKERLTLREDGDRLLPVGPPVRRSARTRCGASPSAQIDDLIDSREPQLLAGIVSDLRVINGQRGRLAIFKLDDKREAIEATRRRGAAQRQPQRC